MQIFLPYTNIIKVAQCLDKRRLHKQIVECDQILKAIKGESEAWKNHPIVKMYSNDYAFIKLYQSILQRYWNLSKTEKNFEEIDKDLLTQNKKDLLKYGKQINNSDGITAYWENKVMDIWVLNESAKFLIPNFINEEYLSTMKGRLYKKDSNFYCQFAPYEAYGCYNMYFVNGEWKYYKQK